MLAQGATEYLVILAVVLMVALVSVSLLGFFPGMSSDAQVTQSQAYWSGTARPFALTTAASTYGTLCGTSSKGGYDLVIQNKEASTLSITNITVDGSSGFCSSGGTLNSAVSFGPGESKTLSVITASAASPCTAGKITQMDLNITYSTQFISGKKQAGSKKLAVRCSTDSPSCTADGQPCEQGVTVCCEGLLCLEPMPPTFPVSYTCNDGEG
jgi:hypothetical protein